jgi:two-component system, LytTR family, response regulator
MNKIRTVIIEDEAPAREILKYYLKDFEEVEIVSECTDGFDGLKKINELKPDLLFLDIQMPKLTGFEMLEVLDEKPAIIFTTAYDQHAIRAFEMNAVDYLLKPFPKERLNEALKKAFEKISRGKDDNPYKALLQKRSLLQVPLARIVLKKGTAITIVPVNQIKYIESEDDYVMIHYPAGKALKQQTMKFYEENLPVTDFARIHRSYIVRLEEIRKIEPYGKDTHIVILHSGEKLPVSRSGYRKLREDFNF